MNSFWLHCVIICDCFSDDIELLVAIPMHKGPMQMYISFPTLRTSERTALSLSAYTAVGHSRSMHNNDIIMATATVVSSTFLTFYQAEISNTYNLLDSSVVHMHLANEVHCEQQLSNRLLLCHN